MDHLELKFKEITGWEMAGDLVVTHEESMETAIPEYCPDLARVVDATGQIRLREKSLVDGKLTVSGSIRVIVLYTSEESPGLRSLTLSVPFSCKVEDKRNCQSINVCGRLLLLEVKALSPRKLYVRALPEFRVRGFQRASRRLCVGVEEDEGLQVRTRQATLPLMTDVWEREFNFAQEIPPEDDQSEAEDLLMDRVFLRMTGCQHFGNKLVVKGEAVLSLLCRGEGQRLSSRELTLPFSQIIEGEDLDEEAEIYCQAQVMEHEIHPVRTQSGNGYGVTIRIGLSIQTFENRSISYVEDLYSTRVRMMADRKTISFPAAHMPDELRRDTAQRLEGAGAFVYLTDSDCSQPEITTADDGRASLHSTVHMKILYLDESGAPVIAERSAEVSGDLGETPSSVQAHVEPESWQRVSSGFEVRIPVIFSLQQMGQEELTAVVSAVEQGEIDRCATPSLVLRRMGEGETLWDVAKQCHTEELAILTANGLEDGADCADRMLLIPKVR